MGLSVLRIEEYSPNILSLYFLDASNMAQDDLQSFLQIVPNIFSGVSGKRMGDVGNYWARPSYS